MALFNKEPDRNLKPQDTPKAGSPPAQSASPTAPQVQDERTRLNGPGASPPTADGRAYLDRGTKISGKLFFEGPTRIDGQVDGEIGASDALTIGDSAVVTAHIKAASVSIAGKVSGDIVASKRIEIRPTARVLGNLTSPVLVVHEGALFEGHCAMQAADTTGREKAVVAHPKEQRAAVQTLAAAKPA